MIACDDKGFILRVRGEYLGELLDICDKCDVNVKKVLSYTPKHGRGNSNLQLIYVAFDRENMFRGNRVLIDENWFWRELNSAPFKVSFVHISPQFEKVIWKGA